jgi:hypothetical protein
LEFGRLRVLRLEDKEQVQQYEALKSKESQDPLGFMKQWSAPWREESLEHYLKMGWCMGYFDESTLQGYSLVQPVLFFNGHTQSLWIEVIRAANQAIFSTLFEAAVKVSREKHLQKTFFSKKLFQDFDSIDNGLKIETSDETLFVRTTKWQD